MYRVHLTAKGYIIDYPNGASTPTSGLTTVKTLLNITISTPGVTFTTTDIK